MESDVRELDVWGKEAATKLLASFSNCKKFFAST